MYLEKVISVDYIALQLMQHSIIHDLSFALILWLKSKILY